MERPTADELEEMRAQLSDLDDLARRFGESFTRSIAGAIRDGRSFEDVLKGLGRRLSNMALSAGLKPLEKLVGQGFEAAFGGAVPFAKGGVVHSPTLFDAGGTLGVMGEAGPEAVVPLSRGADGRLGIAGGGGAGGAMNVTVNISTPDAGSFAKSEAQVTTALARAVSRARRNA